MSTSPAAADLIARSNRLGADPRNTNYAGGNTSAKGTVNDPATGQLLANVANLGPQDAQAAIAAANAAWPTWKQKTAKERSILLRKWYDLLMANPERQP